MKLFKLLLLLAFLAPVFAYSQKKAPFQNEIQAFQKKDSLKAPLKNGILFVGSSSFTRWTDLEKTFIEYSAINRGFGGSTLANAIYYAEDVIFPYEPKQILIYSGENDLAEGSTPEVTFDRFKLLLGLIRKHMPTTPVAYISIKPSPSRAKFMPQMVYTNALIKSYLAGQQHTEFINIYDAMLLSDGKPDPGIFGSDNLHMNQKGYDIWIKAIRPYLKK